jgi:hypothetical protein
MNNATATKIATTLPALAIIAGNGVDHTARKGARIRIYRKEGELLQSSPVVAAIAALLGLGAKVKVYEGDRIYAPVMDGEQVVWTYRVTTKIRHAVVVEVVL